MVLKTKSQSCQVYSVERNIYNKSLGNLDSSFLSLSLSVNRARSEAPWIFLNKMAAFRETICLSCIYHRIAIMTLCFELQQSHEMHCKKRTHRKFIHDSLANIFAQKRSDAG